MPFPFQLHSSHKMCTSKADQQTESSHLAALSYTLLGTLLHEWIIPLCAFINAYRLQTIHECALALCFPYNLASMFGRLYSCVLALLWGSYDPYRADCVCLCVLCSLVCLFVSYVYTFCTLHVFWLFSSYFNFVLFHWLKSVMWFRLDVMAAILVSLHNSSDAAADVCRIKKNILSCYFMPKRPSSVSFLLI